MVEMHLRRALPLDRMEVMTMAARHERHRGFLAAPRGILKIRMFLTPFGVAIRYFRRALRLVFNVPECLLVAFNAIQQAKKYRPDRL